MDGAEASYTWLSPGMVAISGNTPLLDSVIEVRRTTPRDIRLVDFVDGTVLKEFDLDLADTQMLFLIQEDTDTLADAILFDHVKDAWDMRGKRVANVGDPVEDHDAVTLAYMQRYVAQFAGQGGGSGGNVPGSGGGGGSAYPPININIDDIKKEILREVLGRIKGMEEEIRADVEEATNRIAEGLERLKNHNADVLRKAGFVIDETAGTATFQALEDFKTETGGRFSDVFQRLDAANAKIDLKASQAELDGTNTRLSAAEASLNAAKADILLKASQTEVDGLSQKITKAETDIDGLNGTIALKAEKATVDGINDRLTAAEVFINANGGSLQGTVIEFQGLKDRLEELAAGVATNAEGISNLLENVRGKLAKAQTELYAKIDEKTEQAMAGLKTELTTLSENAAAVALQKVEAKATELQAEIDSVKTVVAQVGENKAAIEAETTVRADETGKLKAKYGVKVDAGGRVIGWEANNDSREGTFDVYADKFRIYSPDAGKNAKPFHYDSTTGKLKLQELEVDGANIKSGSITNAHLSNIQITNAMLRNIWIDGAQIKNASIDGSHLKSGAISHFSNHTTSPYHNWVDGNYYLGVPGGHHVIHLSGSARGKTLVVIIELTFSMRGPVQIGFLLDAPQNDPYNLIPAHTILTYTDQFFEGVMSTTVFGACKISHNKDYIILNPSWEAHRIAPKKQPPWSVDYNYSAVLQRMNMACLLISS